MKKTVTRLALHAETVRALNAADLAFAAGGMQCPYTISQLLCPDTWCASCADSCTADLRTT